MVQLLAYCKPQEEGAACDDSIDLSFASKLAASVTGSTSDEGCVTPAQIQNQISLASSQMSASQIAIRSDAQLMEAMGEGVQLLDIVGSIFSAVGNIIDIIDCKVAYESFQRMLVILDEEANQTFKDIAQSEIMLAIMLAILFAVSRFTAYVLDRPKKLYCCLETGRWFRFKAAYNAHVTLLKKKKKFGVGNLLKVCFVFPVVFHIVARILLTLNTSWTFFTVRAKSPLQFHEFCHGDCDGFSHRSLLANSQCLHGLV